MTRRRAGMATKVPGPQQTRSSSDRIRIAGIVAAGLLVGVGAVTAVALSLADAPEVTVAGTTAAKPTSTTREPTSNEVTPREPAPPTDPAEGPPSPVANPAVVEEPTDLTCSELGGRGYNYSDAVFYWHLHARPERLDPDSNDIPCETDFPLADVEAQWGAVPGTGEAVETLERGLLCVDLLRFGHTYAEAMDYWVLWDGPPGMDLDGNGIPCETDYPADVVADFWAW